MNVTWIQQQKNLLDQISPTVCLAKFYNVTLYLENGHNHSCVHPRMHLIPAEEVEKNVHALHNSEYKKSVRQQMLQGQRPPECGYCWRMEDTEKNLVPDRILFSSHLMQNHSDLLQEVADQKHNFDYKPREVEVSFSSTCNFKCTYCGPEFSTRWMKDIVKNNTLIPIHQSIENRSETIAIKKNNPYIAAFWRWLPDVYGNLTQLRVTGGEPLLHSDTYRLIDWVQQHPKPDLDLGINTNLGIPSRLFDKFIFKIDKFSQSKSVKSFTVWTSGESSRDQFNYIRLGGDYSRWMSNIQTLLTMPHVNVKIMTTYSLLSVPGYLDFLQDISALIKQFPGRIMIDHTYLQYPAHLRLDILTQDFLPVVKQQLDFVKLMHSQGLAPAHNVSQAQRLYAFFQHKLDNPGPDLKKYRQLFHQFISEFDRRNGLDFVSAFPELAEFYHMCGQA